MKNPFKKEAANYKGEEPITPYQKAHQEWDLRIGTATAQAQNWRLFAIISLTVALLLLITLVSVLLTRKDKVYIAEVNQSGRVVNVAPLLIRYQPNEAQKAYFIGRFIELVRSLSLDPVVANKNWKEAYSFLTARSAERLSAYFKQANPTALLGNKTITTQILDVNPVSPSTIHMRWAETVTNTNGQVESKKNYSGVFTLVIKAPTSQEEILRNPLGIYIVDFDISQQD